MTPSSNRASSMPELTHDGKYGIFCARFLAQAIYIEKISDISQDDVM